MKNRLHSPMGMQPVSCFSYLCAPLFAPGNRNRGSAQDYMILWTQPAGASIRPLCMPVSVS